MKKNIYKLCIILVALVFVTGCQKEYPIKFGSGSSVLGFSKSSLILKENGTAGSVNIYLGAAEGFTATDVILQVSVEGIANPAVEGTDFTISSKSVSVNSSEAAVTITPIDNSIFQGNKQFKLLIASNSQNYPISAQRSVTVTLSDDEHPLKAWIGTYKVAAASYGSPGKWDEEWTVTTSPVEGKLDQLSIVGLGTGGSGSTIPIIATLDKVGMTISFNSEQPMGEAYGSNNGAVSLYFGTADILDQLAAQAEVTSAMLTAAASIKIQGTLDADGTISADKFGMILTDYNWPWDVFNTTWTKQ
jgi:hypothetical protein